jgi:hypothetical protein
MYRTTENKMDHLGAENIEKGKNKQKSRRDD